MSTHMPVTSILNEAFSFGIKRYWTSARCLLLPYIIMIFGVVILMLGLIDFGAIMDIDGMSEPETPEDVFAIIDMLFRGSWLVTIGVFFIGTMILSIPFVGGIVSIYRLVGIGEEPGGWFSLRLDAPVWRTIIAYIIWTLIQWAIYGVAILLALSMTPDAFVMFQDIEALGDNPDLMIPFFAFLFQVWIFSIIPMIIIFTKIAPFVAATACENRLMLISAWRMTKGHFWTILGSFILMSLALGLTQVIFQLIAQFGDVMLSVIDSTGLAAGLFGLIVFAASLAVAFFTIGVQSAFAAILYRRLWLERGEGA